MLLEWLKRTNKIIFCSQTGEILLEAIFGVCFKRRQHFFTPSFDYTKPVIAMVCEASKVLGINKTNHIITISLYGDDFKIKEKI